MSAALIVFARAPERAKSRLAAACGRAGAARIAAALLADALARGERGALAPRYLYWDGAPDHPAVAAARRRGWRTAEQDGADLGGRMAAAFAAVLREHPHALLIGTDCPDLGAAILAEAAAGLDAADAVLVPATDGGYVLIGLRRAAFAHLDALFSGTAWGGADVAAATRTHLGDCGLSLFELPPLPDLDDAADLERLAARHEFLRCARPGGDPPP